MSRAAVLVALLAALLSACSQGGAGSTQPVRTDQVELPKSYRFEPEVIEVDAGTTVTWTNNDDFPHNVHLLDGSDASVSLPLGESGSLTFDDPGTVEYECSLHPQQMQGTVIVR
jgi:plastocyanin